MAQYNGRRFNMFVMHSRAVQPSNLKWKTAGYFIVFGKDEASFRLCKRMLAQSMAGSKYLCTHEYAVIITLEISTKIIRSLVCSDER